MNDERALRIAQLRRVAEARLKEGPGSGGSLSADNALEVVHELQVHQVELEIQNIELQEAQHELERSREFAYRLFHNAPVGYLVLDDVGMIQRANDTFCRLVRHESRQVVGRPFADFLAADGQALFRARFGAVFKSPDGKTMEVDVVRADHSRFSARLEATTLLPRRHEPYENEAMLLVTVSDITDRKEAEEALRASEERFRAIADYTADLELWLDAAGRLMWVNPAVEEMTGYTVAEAMVMGNFPIGLVHDADRALVRNALAVTPGSRGNNLEFRLQHKTGEMRWGSLAWQPIADRSGRPMGVRASVRNVTELRALEDQLREAQKLESVGRLAGGVAHDFNNRLQVIRGNTELALFLAVDPVREYLLEIQRAAAHSAQLTRQLLSFARREVVSPKLVDLNEIVESTQQMLRRVIGEDLLLIWNPGPDLWRVRIDPAQVGQALVNLVTNARDALVGVDRGMITIDTRNVQVTTRGAAPAWMPPGEYVRLTVRDTGAGIPADDLEHLFEPFFTTKGVGQGSGLGLSMVYGIVKQNGGYVTVESALGKGTSIVIHLPRVATDGVLPAAPGAVESAAATVRATVLVVEDEANILSLCVRALKREGYRVLEAASPHEALAVAANYEAPIDLLITDVVMPGMNGRQLGERLAASRPGLRCLFMSGYSADVLSTDGELDTSVRFIGKPFGMSDLVLMVREALDAPQ
ncbi:MAG: PAS domain S-box protein [Gemmatimonadota bacterium]|nr:PAS domain S-box protein [Gemmatimonadota bacterium]